MFKALWGDLKKSPVKMILTLLTVALGTGLLMLALSISDYLEGTVKEKLERGGVIVSYINGTYDGDGLDRQQPPVTDRTIFEHLEQDLPGFVAGAPVQSPYWENIKVGGTTWQIRKVIATTPEYQEIMAIRMMEGVFFTGEQSDKGSKVAVMSESTAELLYGSAAEAVGRTFTPPEQRFNRPGQGGDSARAITTYEVIGVFQDTDELFRRSYEMGDIIVPLASMVPSGFDLTRIMGRLYSQGVFKVEDMSLDKASANANMSLSMAYGEESAFYFWEGDTRGNTTSLDEIRATLSTFTIVISLLGFVLLITSSIGILSIMMVEALGRSREIALKRALGASKAIMAREYFVKSLTLSGLCALVGLMVAIFFITPFSQLVTPLFEGLSLEGLSPPQVTLSALVTALFTALLAGGVLGTLPLLSIMKGVISETIREG